MLVDLFASFFIVALLGFAASLSNGILLNSKGNKVLAINSDAANDIQMAIATCSKKTVNCTFSPIIFGKNTIIVVSVPVITANETLSTPRNILSIFSCLVLAGLLRCSAAIDSVITTELSTSIPTANNSPIIDRILSV